MVPKGSNSWNLRQLKWSLQSNFTGNTQAVLWMDSPQHEVVPGTPIAQIFYHIDNCSIHHNTGAVIDTQVQYSNLYMILSFKFL